MESVDAIVMGRTTFEQVLTFGEWFYGERRFIVMSRTRQAFDVHEGVTADIEVSSLEPAVLTAELQSAGVRHVYVDGGKIIQAFLRAGLIDELTITRIPILIGEGIPLFAALEGDVHWTHLSTKAFSSGVVQSHYRRRPE